MKLTLHYKLFGAILIAILAVVIYMSLVLQWSFDRGFLNYVNTVEREQLNEIAGELESYYKEYKSWDGIAEDPSKIAFIVIASLPESRLKERLVERFNKKQFTKIIASGPLPSDLPPYLPPRVYALDKNRKIIFGYQPGKNQNDLIDLMFQNRIIGYLGVHPSKILSSSHQVVFAKQQKLTLFLTAVAGFLIAAALSLPFSLLITRPIRRVAEATRELASGRYHTRVNITTRDEFGQLSKDFNNLAMILEKNQQSRSQWVADISHELRTPLSILRGKIEALQDGVYPPTGETFSSLHQEALHLEMLVEDLYQLSLSDIGAMSYHRVEADPCWALKQAIGMLQAELEDKEQLLDSAIEIEDHVTIFADNERLTQLFTNLLSNSIRYTNRKGRVKIAVYLENDCIIYDIQDSAPSVADEHLPRLFERLYRVDSSRSRNLGGAGLGLSISHNIVKGHNGTIEAKHSPLGGLWIRVVLPLME